MTYGLRVVNENSYIQIDSETPRLCAIHKGSYSSSSSSTVVTFPSPITTQEPPCIFIRNDPSRNDDLYDRMYITGSAGNWTGFYLRANNVNMRPLGKWFAAVFASKASSQYGLRLWDGAGGIIYDSGASPVIFTKASQDWAYFGKVSFPTLGSAYYYGSGLVAPIAADEYFLINQFSRGVVSTSGVWQDRGVRYNYNSQRLEMYIVTNDPSGPWIDQGQPGAIFARLPGS